MVEKFILDATAGFRMMWFDKKHPNCIYLDQRPECEPDIVGDFRDLKQFADETFRLIIFDPPHIISNGPQGDSNMRRMFGFLEPDTWASDIERGLKECWRILAFYGILLFKWNTHKISSEKVIKLFPTSPLIYQISTNKKNLQKGGKRLREVQTLWFCFMKIPKEAQP
jgi:23S rRNA G2069 N7-methylase RlmK/C1962 C5-methylase RlmI